MGRFSTDSFKNDIFLLLLLGSFLFSDSNDRQNYENDQRNNGESCNQRNVLAYRRGLQILIQSVIFTCYQHPIFSFVAIADHVEYHQILKTLKYVPYRVHPRDLYQIVQSVSLKCQKQVKRLFGSEEQTYRNDQQEHYDTQSVSGRRKGLDARA